MNPRKQRSGETHYPSSIAAQNICCYPVHSMPKKKTKIKKAVEKTVDFLLAHFCTVPPAEARAMRKEIRDLAAKVTRSARRKKTSKSPRKAGLRRLSRTPAKTA
jgi:hypothetical protein